MEDASGPLRILPSADVVTGAPGTWAFAPRGTPHTLANLGAQPVRLLCLFAPGGLERRFQRMLDPDAFVEATESERATRVVGPPLSEGGTGLR